jgi:uncharacterized protein DUF3658
MAKPGARSYGDLEGIERLPMDIDELDAAILSHVEARWLKTARIAGAALAEFEISPSDDQVEVVIARLRALVAQGRLLAKGNLSRPRYSEVRLSPREGAPADPEEP